MKTNIFDTRAGLEERLCLKVVEILKENIEKRGKSSILFSGGSTPRALMNRLAEQRLDWSKVEVGLVDDRMVDETSEYSNGAMLKREFLNRIVGVKPIFYPLVVHAEDHAANMSSVLETLPFNNAVDVVLLGMGTDGHFASLFPNDEASSKGLSENFESALLYTEAPAYPQQRISFSRTFLEKADHLFLHITGMPKIELLETERERALPIDTLLTSQRATVAIYWSA